ncbi:hypothetical protein H4219_006409, partial [Mycoemilia scoparia]
NMMEGELDDIIDDYHLFESKQKADKIWCNRARNSLNDANKLYRYLELQTELRNNLNRWLVRNDPVFDCKRYEKELKAIESDIKMKEKVAVSSSEVEEPHLNFTHDQTESLSSPDSQEFVTPKEETSQINEFTTDSIPQQEITHNDNTYSQGPVIASSSNSGNSIGKRKGLREKFRMNNGTNPKIKVTNAMGVVYETDSTSQEDSLEAPQHETALNNEQVQQHNKIMDQEYKKRIEEIKKSSNNNHGNIQPTIQENMVEVGEHDDYFGPARHDPDNEDEFFDH